MGCPIHGHPAMACEHCEAVYARAFTTARADGYAEAVADVVAWLRASPGLDRAMNATTFAANRIEAGAHVGAAKKGGAP